MSADRVVYSFVLAWVVLIVVLIVLDWLGNPNRGSFRPKGDRPLRDRSARKADRERARLDDDALVRATLRDAYGASSLRLGWNEDDEASVRQLDDTLILDDVPAGVLDAPSREIVQGPPLDVGSSTEDDADVSPSTPIVAEPVEPDPTPLETEGDPEPMPVEAEADPEPMPEPVDAEPTVVVVASPPPDDAATQPAEPAASKREVPQDGTSMPKGWRLGDDPLALTAKGTPPAPATIRSRVWKNLAATGSWGEENLGRLSRGLPPVRTDPRTGAEQRAVVDVRTGQPSWGDEPIDPFGTDHS